ncbi:MAG: hypothetical protein ACLTWK_13050, partial [Eisenbergiella sp.]
KSLLNTETCRQTLFSYGGRKKLNEFIEVFGGMKVAAVVIIIAAIVFMWKIYKVVENHFRKKYDAEAQKVAQMNDILEQVKKYPDWRKQSIEYQKKYAEEIRTLQEKQNEIIEELRKNEEKRKKVKRSELRDRLLQSYRYYTSPEKNPMQAWSEMEADAFWEIFGDYERVDGDGHIHTDVQPAMRRLDVVKMEDAEKIAELMKSRR